MTFVMRKGLQKGRSRPQHLVFAVWHSNNLQADRKAFMKAARDGNGRKSQPVEHHGVRRINGREIGVWLPAIGILPGSIPIGRSEEHTSELQSLMRISYAVFCLKKQKTTPNNKLLQHKTLITHTRI